MRLNSCASASSSSPVRTPLNAILGFSDVLRERMFGPLNAKQLEYVSDIHSSGQHLLSLINDILDLSKVEAGRMELDVHVFDVRAALETCCALVRERALRRGVRLALDVHPEVRTWRADERRFKQVMLNLMSNAVKFTPAGGAVTVDARIDHDALVASVTDTGIGVPAAHLETIFQEFRQLPGPEETRREGTGLGLALSRRLVALHGGTLTVRSEPGRGSTFTARFPHLVPTG